MFISMNHIRGLFSAYSTILKNGDTSVCLTHYARFDSLKTYLDPHVLYMTDSISQLKNQIGRAHV